MTLRGSWFGVLLFIIFAFLLPRAKADVFRARLAADPMTLDWNVASTTYETHVLLNLMRGLARFDDKMQAQPDLAESWNVSRDGMTWTFLLKKNVKWSDGQALVAQQFVDSWQRLLKPETAAPYASFLFDIIGAEEFYSGQTKDPNAIGIKALDPHKLQIKLKHPVAFFPQLTTFWVTFPIRNDLIQKFGPAWTKPENLVVLGAFKLESFNPRNELTLIRNPHFSEATSGVEKIIFRIIPETTTAVNLFRAGQLDFLSELSFTEIGNLENSAFFHRAPYDRVVFLSYQNNKLPFSDPKCRSAIDSLINTSIFKKIFHDNKEPAYSFIPKAMFPVAALRDSKKSGHNFCSFGDKQNLELITDNTEDFMIVAQYLQQLLKEKLGIHLTIRPSDPKTAKSLRQNGIGHLYIRRWGADYPDPNTFLDVLTSTSGNNQSNWKSSEYDSLTKELRSTFDAKKRTNQLEKLIRIIRDQAPVTPLYFDTHLFLLNPLFKGFRIDRLNYIYLDKIRKVNP